jgi:hypothetical protein
MQLIRPSAAKAATKYSRLVEAARCQPSALIAQLLHVCRFDFNDFVRQNFFAKRKEVTDKESIRHAWGYHS